ncbi:MAG: Fe-S cluster assembly protein SufD [Phycisphaerae bacterium]
MIDKKTIDNPSFAELFSKAITADAPKWVKDRREAAFARYASYGIPTIKDEEWRYTDVSRVAESSYVLPPTIDESRVVSLVAEHAIDEAVAVAVFVNGRFSKGLSRLEGLSDRVVMGSLADQLASDNPDVQSNWGRCDEHESSSFSSLNEALFEDGLFLSVSHEVVLEKPIQALFVTIGDGEPVCVSPRVLAVLGTSCQASLVETHVGEGEYFTNNVTEILAGENAVFDHYHVERESERSVHMSTIQMLQARNSNVASKVISLDGQLIRHDMGVKLDGEGADCNLRGFYMVDGERHVDNHLHVDHAKPHCDSREFFKGVLDGAGRGVFRGRILVREHAQKTDAKQTNQSLLLSGEARVESKPQLEIFADDVKCTHGATIGQIDESAMFYLQSRGLSKDAARTLLVYAFACESLDEIKVDTLREQVNNVIVARLPQGQLFKDA